MKRLFMATHSEQAPLLLRFGGSHLLVSGAGEPVEFSVAPAWEAEVKVFKDMDLELPEGATIHADKGYTDYR
jgi:hypothetical protein